MNELLTLIRKRDNRTLWRLGPISGIKSCSIAILGFIPESIEEELGLKYGSKYSILEQPKNEVLLKKCMEVMKMD